MIPADNIPPAIHFTLPRPPALCLDRMADAIRAVEGAGLRTRGPSGEWGAWQVMPKVWRKYSRRMQWSAPEQEQRRVHQEQEAAQREAAAELARAQEQERERSALVERQRLERLREEERLRQEQDQRTAAERQRQQEQAAAERVRQQQEQEQQRQQETAQAAQMEAARTEYELVQSATALIQQVVQENWSRPPSARNGMRAILQIRMLPTGELVDATITQSSGDPAFDRSAENAVFRAAPFRELASLPITLFNANFRTLSLIFEPEDLLN